MRGLLFSLVPTLTAQLDPATGTAKAQQGAVQRLQDPSPYDVVFPLIAFAFVIALPLSVAIWVIYKTVTEKQGEADEV